jgi:hypothetical protein
MRGNETTRLDEAVEAIAAQGRDRGFVTSTDLLQGLSAEDLSPEEVEAFLMDLQEYLRQEAIEVLETRREASEDELGRPRGIRQGRDEVFANDAVRLYLNEIAKVRLLTACGVHLFGPLVTGHSDPEKQGSAYPSKLSGSPRTTRGRMWTSIVERKRFRLGPASPETDLAESGNSSSSLGDRPYPKVGPAGLKDQRSDLK